ncbi:unnamed protein product [Hyaloperonospora brassicae]|uniref:Myb-like domain-containing protein n=1 Tax=Hyaloperonospora brassicae TaxID=162125 RepID=A0AAV0TP03_HYABA|nr:unnamed protein product [Hyaloperonospora brassicae]
MRAALEVCGEFLSRIGALQDVNAIAGILHKTGVKLSETSPFRWRALLAAIRHELDASPMDSVFLFDRVLQLHVMMSADSSLALFRSPLFLHLVVQRFAVAYEGLDAELFKLESDELCHVDGIYETGGSKNEELTTFLETFEKIFEQGEPKECWDVFYESHRLKGPAFRRDMKRALCVIESAALGPTKLELAFPTDIAGDTRKVIPRSVLERSPGLGLANARFIPPNDLKAEVVHSDVSDEPPASERPVPSRPSRSAEAARVSHQEGRCAAARTRVSSEDNVVTTSGATGRPTGRRKRVRWSAEEEEALIEGYRLYHKYSSVWKLIKTKFPDVLRNRSNVDLKDKFRNLKRYNRILRATANGNDNGDTTDNDATDDNAGTADKSDAADT